MALRVMVAELRQLNEEVGINTGQKSAGRPKCSCGRAFKALTWVSTFDPKSYSKELHRRLATLAKQKHMYM